MSSKYLGEIFDIHGGGMDLQFPHHESEIAQSTIVHGQAPVKYWMHNNMITINGKKMGKSYNNVIKLTELFSGNHPILEQAYHPMVIRFYILQTHYRSTLDFSNEALQASEKALKRIWESYEVLKTLPEVAASGKEDKELNERVISFCNACEADMLDDFNTAKVLANLFELAPIANGIKGGQIAAEALLPETLKLFKETFQLYLEDILGLQTLSDTQNNDLLDEVMNVIIELRKEARSKKDFALSDLIRDKLIAAGIQLKDGKDGSVSYQLL
jgi:cysteinyl-tRNA synthetase